MHEILKLTTDVVLALARFPVPLPTTSTNFILHQESVIISFPEYLLSHAPLASVPTA